MNMAKKGVKPINVSSRKILLRNKALEECIKRYKNIVFYLHGHTHQHIFADLRKNGYPIILDSGSSAHNSIGSFNVLELFDHQCNIDVYRRKDKKWNTAEKKQIEI